MNGTEVKRTDLQQIDLHDALIGYAHQRHQYTSHCSETGAISARLVLDTVCSNAAIRTGDRELELSKSRWTTLHKTA